MDKFERERHDSRMGLSPKELIQQLANAQVTYSQSGGHSKAIANLYFLKDMKVVARARNIEIPPKEELLKVGIFNGNGAY